MNKLEVSIEFSFDIDAGTIELFDDVKLNTNRLIHPEVFFERYRRTWYGKARIICGNR